MAVGLPLKTTYANGDVYSASDVNDTNGTVNLVGQTNNFYAGKNKVINGDFNINQRAFTSTGGSGAYTFDRWRTQFVGGTVTYSTQAFTPGTAPVSGYEGKNYARLVISGQTNSGGDFAIWNQRIEDVRTYAGQTTTVSFWAKAASGTPKISASIEQNFGSGGSGSVYVYGSAPTISTSWARYSITIAVPSISGKTVGTSSFLSLNIEPSNAYNTNLGYQNGTFDIWGIQMESGSTATAFQTATGTIQGELAACQRYYFRTVGNDNELLIPAGFANTTVIASGRIQYPVPMRVAPTSLDTANLKFSNFGGGSYAMTSVAYNQATTLAAQVYGTIVGGTAGQVGCVLGSANSLASYVGLSAEL